MKTPTTGLIAVLGASALLAAGCGSSSKSTSTTSAAATTPATTAQSTTAATTTPAASGTIVAVKHSGKLGSVLSAGSKKLTVYMFEGDKGASSKCTGECAAVWPPVTTSGAPTASGAASSTNLGTITRADGTTQVTYKGHPLYFFAKDKDSGDAYGEGVHGFGDDWYVLTPSGKEVDDS